MNELRTTNKLLLIIVVPLVFYLLKLLSFIFIPLIFSMFIALLFLPIMRWLNKKKVSKPISIVIVILIFIGALKIGGELIQLTSKEILSADNAFFQKAETKLEAYYWVWKIILEYPIPRRKTLLTILFPKKV